MYVAVIVLFLFGDAGGTHVLHSQPQLEEACTASLAEALNNFGEHLREQYGDQNVLIAGKCFAVGKENPA
jgi:hypothetical protein